MSNHYNRKSKVYYEEVKEAEKEQKKYDRISLLIWLITIIISLLPLYLSVLDWLVQGKNLDINFYFEIIVRKDTIWVFSTILLFALINSYMKNKENKNKIKKLWIFGAGGFVFMLATYIFNENHKTEVSWWRVILGIVFILFSLIISTPLQANYIKNEDDKKCN